MHCSVKFDVGQADGQAPTNNVLFFGPRLLNTDFAGSSPPCLCTSTSSMRHRCKFIITCAVSGIPSGVSGPAGISWIMVLGERGHRAVQSNYDCNIAQYGKIGSKPTLSTPPHTSLSSSSRPLPSLSSLPPSYQISLLCPYYMHSKPPTSPSLVSPTPSGILQYHNTSSCFRSMTNAPDPLGRSTSPNTIIN